MGRLGGTRAGDSLSGMRTVADAMRAPPVVVDAATTIQAASARMLDAGMHAAVVVDGGRVRGVVTVDSVARALAHGLEATETPVRAIAEADAPLARPDEPLAEAHVWMRAQGRALVAVVAASGEAVGLLEDHEASV